MENIEDGWVNNECGDFMWDEALKFIEEVPAKESDKTIKLIVTPDGDLNLFDKKLL